MKPCAERSKKDLVQTCKDDKNITVGLGKLGKEELVALCCFPDGPKAYLETAVKNPGFSLARNTTAGDIVLSMGRDDAPFIREIVKQRPNAPSKDFWQLLKRHYGITKGNVETGNPVDCSVSIPPVVKDATLLLATGRDAFDNKDEIKDTLGGTYFASLSSGWAWETEKCDDLASKNLLLDDIRIKPCTVVVLPRDVNGVAKKAVEMISNDVLYGPWGPTETQGEAVKRAEKWRKNLRERFNVEPDPVTVERLARDPATMKYFHESFGTFPEWRCEDPGDAVKALNDGIATRVPLEQVPHVDVDVAPSYLDRQRAILPEVLVADVNAWIDWKRTRAT